MSSLQTVAKVSVWYQTHSSLPFGSFFTPCATLALSLSPLVVPIAPLAAVDAVQPQQVQWQQTWKRTLWSIDCSPHSHYNTLLPLRLEPCSTHNCMLKWSGPLIMIGWTERERRGAREWGKYALSRTYNKSFSKVVKMRFCWSCSSILFSFFFFALFL